MKLALNGCLGKMGRRIAEIALAQGHSLVALIDAQGGGKSYQELTGIKAAAPVTAQYEGGADALIDFSLP
ncbi:MAG: hypothetical protein HUU03_11535, partial [Planctomycetaceae bacterium]|nr:hypothetical protein [Planctomycetaceae bacterium]